MVLRPQEDTDGAKGELHVSVLPKVKDIEKYICENYEEWYLDDPVGEGLLEEYEDIPGASTDLIEEIQNHLGVEFPEDLTELYRYKNGSGLFTILPIFVEKASMTFELLPLEEVKTSCDNFHAVSARLAAMPVDKQPPALTTGTDARIKPSLFLDVGWIPFAIYADSCYLMLDFAPGPEGRPGQIICYIHDPDKVVYISESFTDLIASIKTTSP